MNFKYILLHLFVSMFIFFGCAKHSDINFENHIDTKLESNITTLYKDQTLLKVKNDVFLDNYLQEVITNNYSLKSLEATKKLFKTNIKITRATMYPSGSIDLKNSRVKNSAHNELSNSVESNVLLNWDLDLWGKFSDEVNATRYEYIDAQNQYLEQKRLLLLNSTLDWINYWYLRQVLENQLGLLQTYSKLTSHYLEESQAGLNDRYFYLQARRAHEIVQNSIFEIKLDLVKVLQQLNFYRGEKPTATLMMSAQNNILPISLDTNNLNISTISLSDRFDIKSSFALFKAATFSEEASYKALLPQVNLSVSGDISAGSISKLFSGEIVWELIGGVSQPLFHADQLLNIAKSKSIESEIAWWNYQERVLQAFLEVENSIETDISLNKQLRHKDGFYHELEQSLKNSKQKTLEGIFDFGDYLQEKADIMEEKNRLLELKTEYIKNRLRLISALGLSITAQEKHISKEHSYEN